jgi:hypothetical protein
MSGVRSKRARQDGWLHVCEYVKKLRQSKPQHRKIYMRPVVACFGKRSYMHAGSGKEGIYEQKQGKQVQEKSSI